MNRGVNKWRSSEATLSAGTAPNAQEMLETSVFYFE